MAAHNQVNNAGAHTPFRVIFANDAARTGDTGPYTAEDATNRVLALQEDTKSVYVLTNHSPITWTQAAPAGAAGLSYGGIEGASYTAVVGEYALVDSSGGAVVVTLPTGSGDDEIGIFVADDTNGVTVNPGGASIYRPTTTGEPSTLPNGFYHLKWNADLSQWVLIGGEIVNEYNLGGGTAGNDGAAGKALTASSEAGNTPVGAINAGNGGDANLFGGSGGDGASIYTGGAGGNAIVQGGSGGVASGSAAAGAGGAFAGAGAAGGNNTGTGAAGAGGVALLNGGAGGVGTAGNGGVGGQASAQGGTGGDAAGGGNAAGAGGDASLAGGAGGAGSTNANGGGGGTLNVQSGPGGNADGTGATGAGGGVTLLSGAGGAHSGSGNGGAGGAVEIRSGQGGTSVSGSPGVAGGIIIQPGKLRVGDDWTNESGWLVAEGGYGADNAAGDGVQGSLARLAGGTGGSTTNAASSAGDGGPALVAGGDAASAGEATAHGGSGGTLMALGGSGKAGGATSGNNGNGGTVEINGGVPGSGGGGTAGVGGEVHIGTDDGLAGAFGLANTSAIKSGNTTNKPKWTHTGGFATPVNDLGAVNAGNVTCDLDDSNNFKVSIQGACTLQFSNLADGQTGHIQVTNDAASPTLAKGTGVRAPGGTIAVLAGSGDIQVYQYLVEGTNINVWPVGGASFS